MIAIPMMALTTTTTTMMTMIDQATKTLTAATLANHRLVFLEVAPTHSTMVVAATTMAETVQDLKAATSSSSFHDLVKARLEVRCITRSNLLSNQRAINARAADQNHHNSDHSQSTSLMRQRNTTQVLWPEMLSPGP
jgi:hypothetical protein